MDDVVIVSTIRSPIGRAYKGALNDTGGAELVAPLIAHLVEKQALDPAAVEEIVLGCGYPEGATGGNVARHAAIRAGLPVSSSAGVVSRFCASGLDAIAYAAKRIAIDHVGLALAGGVESISLVLPSANKTRLRNPWLEEHKPSIYSTMIETADTVAKRYAITREAQDAFSVDSQARTAAAQDAGLFDAEILPFTVEKSVVAASGETARQSVTLSKDEGNRPDTSLEGLAQLKPVREGQFVTAGNASQLSDGASICLLTSSREAARHGLEPLAVFRGMAASGCEPDEMGIGPVFAVPRLLKRFGLSVDDIDLWELNEAFASQSIYCRDRLGIAPERVNVNGGAISIGHPFGMSGARMVGHLILEGRRRRAKYGVVTMCVAGGMGCAGLIEFV